MSKKARRRKLIEEIIRLRVEVLGGLNGQLRQLEIQMRELAKASELAKAALADALQER